MIWGAGKYPDSERRIMSKESREKLIEKLEEQLAKNETRLAQAELIERKIVILRKE